jgi:16S rRNA C1402 N4-methylase RsmH
MELDDMEVLIDYLSSLNKVSFLRRSIAKTVTQKLISKILEGIDLEEVIEEYLEHINDRISREDRDRARRILRRLINKEVRRLKRGSHIQSKLDEFM